MKRYYFSGDDSYEKPTLYLGSDEWARIVSEINTNYEMYKGKRVAVHASYDLYDGAYLYYFEIRGFDDYNIFAKIPIY